MHEEVDLKPSEVCLVDLYKARCAGQDPCMVDCWVNRRHGLRDDEGGTAFVAGGCYHICYAYRGVETPPDGAEACYELDEPDEP